MPKTYSHQLIWKEKIRKLRHPIFLFSSQTFDVLILQYLQAKLKMYEKYSCHAKQGMHFGTLI